MEIDAPNQSSTFYYRY